VNGADFQAAIVFDVVKAEFFDQSQVHKVEWVETNFLLARLIHDGLAVGYSAPALPLGGDAGKRLRRSFSPCWDRWAFRIEGQGSGFWRHGRTGYVGAGLSARTMARSRSASGQAEANATRIRVALSITRAATLSCRRRRVVNSAFARAAVFGIAC
jgi:hypothetical protein